MKTADLIIGLVAVAWFVNRNKRAGGAGITEASVLPMGSNWTVDAWDAQSGVPVYPYGNNGSQSPATPYLSSGRSIGPQLFHGA